MPLSLDPDRQRPTKRPGGFMGLFDTPVFRDWLAWWTAFWVIAGALSIIFPTAGSRPPTQLPVWFNAVLSAVVIGLIMGVLPAYLRVLVRRGVIARRRRRGGHTPVPARQAPESTSPAPPGSTSDISPSTGTPVVDASGHQVAPTKGTPLRSSLDAPGRVSYRTPATSQSNDLQSDEVLTMASGKLPYPLARACRRLQLAVEPKEQYEATLRAGETLATVLGSPAAAWSSHRGVRTPQMDSFVEAMLGRGVPQGLFADVAASLERPMNGDDGLPGFAAAMRRTKGKPGMHNELKAITAERNLWAHGASPRSQAEASQRLQNILPPLVRALELASALSAHEWLLVSDSTFDRHSRKFDLTASRAMGAHPDWDRVHLVSDSPVAQDSLFVSTPAGLLDLTPFCVVRAYPVCGQNEVAYADRLHPSRGVSLKSFDSGHSIFDLDLVRDVRALSGPAQDGASSI